MITVSRYIGREGRPRDLYDVVYLLENSPDGLDHSELRRILIRKCRAKNLDAPTSHSIASAAANDAELAAEWANMLAHQLPLLPELTDLLPRVQPLLQWIEVEKVVVTTLAPAAPPATGERLVSPVGMQYSGGGLPLETIRFAGANRLLLEFEYSGKQRRVEPYSLREAQSTGNLLLYAYELSSGQIKAFNVAKISGLRPTREMFIARYAVEFSPSGSFTVPVHARSRPAGRRRSSSDRGAASNRRYIIECPVCRRRFRRSRNDTRLRKHETKDGWPCSGRRGNLIEVR
jgi:hypothetical protein